MAAFNSTVASVPAQDYVFVFKRRPGGPRREPREAGEKAARCWAHMVDTRSTLTANYCWVLQEARSFEHFLLQPQKRRVLYVPKRQPSKGQTPLDYILTKQPDRRLLHRPPPKPDHNPVYEKVRIPRRSAQKPGKEGQYQANSKHGQPQVVNG